MENGASSVSMIVFRRHCYTANCTIPKKIKWSIKRPPRPSLVITLWLHLRNRSGLIIDAASNEQEHSLITQDVSLYSNGFHQRVIRTVFPEKVRQTKFIHSSTQVFFLSKCFSLGNLFSSLFARVDNVTMTMLVMITMKVTMMIRILIIIVINAGFYPVQ